MAIFYNYIKGCGNAAEVSSGLNTTPNGFSTTHCAWTFLKWADTIKYVKQTSNVNEDMHFANNNPTIRYDATTNYDSNESQTTGRILTSQAREQEIWYDLTFKSGPETGAWASSGNTTTGNVTKFEQKPNSFYTETSDWTINDSSNNNKTALHIYGNSSTDRKNTVQVGESFKFLASSSAQIVGDAQIGKGPGDYSILYVTSNQDKNDPVVDITGRLVVFEGATFGSGGGTTNKVSIPGSTGGNFNVYTNMVIDPNFSCSAGYFNATSDKRAKENIKQANFSAIDIINQLNIYSFNYKNSDKPTIGILAQEALNTKINNFSLVENENASGENDDYMSIKESKLIYILWKAIQEQQEEIAQLKKKLEVICNE